MKPRPRTLGTVQRSVLRAIQSRGYWYEGCGWIWSNPSKTVRVLDSLVARGYVRKTVTPAAYVGGADAVRYDYIEPDTHADAQQERLIQALTLTVTKYAVAEDTGAIVNVPDDLLLALAQTATNFFEDGGTSE